MKLIDLIAICVVELNALNLCYDQMAYCKDFVNRPGNLCQTNFFVKNKCKESCGFCGGPKPLRKGHPSLQSHQDHPCHLHPQAHVERKPQTRIVRLAPRLVMGDCAMAGNA
ncbi:hypothetical protein OS493_003310 [Desmophyllum pertusum]|uniref:ShKT domain-containing protein n=1 Tax=Desmophyllum pertusum TaxID=174260 RepID=A0A9X0A8R8_9CNID|nr:hypothetical protein OS493_003310 [Desmophyllum pertusum]